MSALTRLKQYGRLRQGRRTPETVYVSLSDDLDDRKKNFPVFLCHDLPLVRFILEAVAEKLERHRRHHADPEAWLADQLAQMRTLDTEVPFFIPGGAAFTRVERIAQEYGEMCAARATEGIE